MSKLLCVGYAAENAKLETLRCSELDRWICSVLDLLCVGPSLALLWICSVLDLLCVGFDMCLICSLELL